MKCLNCKSVIPDRDKGFAMAECTKCNIQFSFKDELKDNKDNFSTFDLKKLNL